MQTDLRMHMSTYAADCNAPLPLTVDKKVVKGLSSASCMFAAMIPRSLGSCKHDHTKTQIQCKCQYMSIE